MEPCKYPRHGRCSAVDAGIAARHGGAFVPINPKQQSANLTMVCRARIGRTPLLAAACPLRDERLTGRKPRGLSSVGFTATANVRLPDGAPAPIRRWSITSQTTAANLRATRTLEALEHPDAEDADIR
jgi:hypothetical protein